MSLQDKYNNQPGGGGRVGTQGGGEAGYQIKGSAGLPAMSGQYPPISITEDKCKRTEVSLT